MIPLSRRQRQLHFAALALIALTACFISLTAQADEAKPNIMFIMGDDIGWMQPSIYHRGLMVGETPNIDRIGNEGAIFMDYLAMQSCTSGRNAFFTGMYPLRTGMIPPQLPGSPSYLRPGTPALSKFLLDLGYNTGEFGKNHLGDHTEALPTSHGFQEFWGYLYHLDAMQQVSFPDINSSPTVQSIAPPCKNTPVPGLPNQARSLRTDGRFRGNKVGCGLGRCAYRPDDRLPIRLEHAADRAVAVDERADVVQGVSAAASAGELQPERDLGGNGESECQRRLVA